MNEIPIPNFPNWCCTPSSALFLPHPRSFITCASPSSSQSSRFLSSGFFCSSHHPSPEHTSLWRSVIWPRLKTGLRRFYGAVVSYDRLVFLTVWRRADGKPDKLAWIRVLVTYQHHMTASLSKQPGLAQTSLQLLHCSVTNNALLHPSAVLDIHST